MDQLPTALKFARTGGARTDIVLNRAEELVDLNNGSAEEYIRLVYACDLFFTLDYWLKYYQTAPQYEKQQAGQVQSLYGTVVNELCKAFQCTVNVLPRELELMFGRELTKEGYGVDVLEGRASYVGSREELAKYRLRFKDGKAYQYPWWQSFLSSGALVLAESARCQPAASVHKGGDKPNWGYCIMSLNREIYMAQHAPCSRDKRGRVHKGAYHSYYLKGQPTQFAGSMLITKGEIASVMPDSGHYKPTDNNTLAFLQALLMYGVPLGGIAVLSWNGGSRVMAEEFIAGKGDWTLLRTNQTATRDQNAASWLSKQSPAFQKWLNYRELYQQNDDSRGSGTSLGSSVPMSVTSAQNSYTRSPVSNGGSVLQNQVTLAQAVDSEPLYSRGEVDDPEEEDFIPDLNDADEESAYSRS